MDECNMCYARPKADGDMCVECTEWSHYWNGLTSEQKRDEIRMMDAYVDECQTGLHD